MVLLKKVTVNTFNIFCFSKNPEKKKTILHFTKILSNRALKNLTFIHFKNAGLF